MAEPIFKAESYEIVGACFEVYNELGCGFLEAVYQECLEHELRLRQIAFQSQPLLPISYKGQKLTKTYQPDLICYDKIIIELKAVSEITDQHRAQILNYLKATDLPLGLLVNFGASGGVEHQRFARTRAGN